MRDVARDLDKSRQSLGAIQEDELETSSAASQTDAKHDATLSSRFKNRTVEHRINCARLSILLVLVVSAITLAVAAFVTMTHGEKKSFRAEVCLRRRELTVPHECRCIAGPLR